MDTNKENYRSQTQKHNQNTKQYTILVSSSDIAKRYNVSSRYILRLATDGTIPCIRIGKKCVRFNPELVAQAIEGQNN